MKEKEIDFETAVLAKEKGFNVGNFVFAKYWNKEEYYLFSEHEWDTQDTSRFVLTGYKGCTQSFLQKWIREIYNIHIVINPMITIIDEKICYFFTINDNKSKEITDWQDHYNSILQKSYQDVEGNYIDNELHDKLIFEDYFAFYKYEEALEYALKKALSFIIH